MTRRRRGSQNPLVAEVAELRAQIAELRDQAVRYVEAPVTAADPGTSTFTAEIAGQVDGQNTPLSGIPANSQFLPESGQTAQLTVAGAQVIYQASTIAENAVTGREIAPASVDEAMLTFNISDVGGTKIWYGSTTPTAGAIGELWVKTLGTVGGVQQHETRRWNGTSWALLADQSVTQALLDAESAQTTADSKNAQFSGPTAPTTGMVVGDEWIDTANGNRVNVYGTVASVLRRNLALNPSFQYDAPATLTSPASASGGYTRFSTGSPGTLTHSIQASGGTQGAQYYKVVGSSMAPTAEMGIILTRPVVAGDVVKASADMWVTVASTTKPVQLYVDILNAAGTVLVSNRVTGNGSTGTQRLITSASLTAPAGAVSVRVWMMRASSSTGANGLPTSAVTTTNADLNIDGVLIDLNPPTSSPVTYFDGTTTGAAWEGTVHLSPSQVNQEATVALGWQPRPIRSGAIEPKSLVAKDVVATGTVSAALLEAIMVLANIIIAGDLTAEYTRLSSAGLTAYAVDPGDGGQVEISRFGRGWSVRNATTGAIAASATDMGDIACRSISASDANPRFGGFTLDDRLWNTAWGIVGHAEFAAPGGFSGSTTGEIPVWEVAFIAKPGRAYRLTSTPLELAADTGSKAYIRTRVTGDGSAPTTSSPLFTEQFVASLDSGWGPGHPLNFLSWGPTMGSPEETRRILVTIAGASSTVKMWRGHLEYFWVEDIGPLPADRGQVQGGTTAKKRYETTYNATWSKSWRADGTTTSFVNGLYQGLKPLDTVNGRQTSAVGFQDLTTVLSGATVENFYIYLYAENWVEATGGIVRLLYHSQTSEPASSPAATLIGTVGYEARGQGKWIDLTALKSQLQAGTFRGLKLDAATDDPLYYARFAGFSGGVTGVQQPQLKVIYTK